MKNASHSSILLCAAVGIGFSFSAHASPSILVDFEEPNYRLGNVHGQQGWLVEQGKAEVVEEWAYSGARSLKLFPAVPFSQARLSLHTGSESSSSVAFIDFYTRPVATSASEQGEMLDINGARIGFFRNPQREAQAEFWVYDGLNEDAQGAWVRTGWSVEIDPKSGLPATWVRLTIREDFPRQVWDLSVNGELVGANLGFVEPVMPNAESYIIMGDSQESVYLDNLHLSERNPLGLDSDKDGIQDIKEDELGFNKFLDDRDVVARASGISAIAAVISSQEFSGAVRPPVAIIAPPKISLNSGYLEGSEEVTIDSMSGQEVFYTLDGADPIRVASSALRYEQKLIIDQPTILRAAVRESSGKWSAVVTRIWIFPDTVSKQTRPEEWPEVFQDQARFVPEVKEFTIPYGVDVLPKKEGASVSEADFTASLLGGPAVSLVIDPRDLVEFERGVYHHSSRSGVSESVAAAVGWWQEGISNEGDVGAMASISGESSRFHDVTLKHSFRIRLDQISSSFGSLLGGPGNPVRHFLLRAPTHDSWAQAEAGQFLRKEAKYITDAWADQWLKKLGYPSIRRQFVHLYLNGLYWGVYEIVEQAGPLSDADSLLAPSADDFDQVRAIYGSSDAWQNWMQHLRELAQVAKKRQAASDAWAGLLERCDEQNLIDYVLLNLWMGNHDWPKRNYLIRDDGLKFQFLNWDAEFGFHFGDDLAKDHFSTLSDAPDGPAAAFRFLCYSPSFRERVRTRLSYLLSTDGALSAQKAGQSYLKSAETFRPLVAAEAARWGNYYDSIHGKPEVWEKNIHDAVSVIAPLRSTELAKQWARFDAELLRLETAWEAVAEAKRLAQNGPKLTPYGAIPNGPAASDEKDSDGDGMSDEWEQKYGFDGKNAEDAMGDRDGDGLSNLEEFLLGLNPDVKDDAAAHRRKLEGVTQLLPLTHGLPKDPVQREEALKQRLLTQPEPAPSTSGNN